MFSIVVTSDVIGAVLIVVSLLKARHKKKMDRFNSAITLFEVIYLVIINLKMELKNKPLKIANIRFYV